MDFEDPNSGGNTSCSTVAKFVISGLNSLLVAVISNNTTSKSGRRAYNNVVIRLKDLLQVLEGICGFLVDRLDDVVLPLSRDLLISTILQLVGAVDGVYAYTAVEVEETVLPLARDLAVGSFSVLKQWVSLLEGFCVAVIARFNEIITPSLKEVNLVMRKKLGASFIINNNPIPMGLILLVSVVVVLVVLTLLALCCVGNGSKGEEEDD